MCSSYTADPKRQMAYVKLPRLPPCHSLVLYLSSKDFALSTRYHPQLGLQMLFCFNDQQKFSQPTFLKAASEVNVGVRWDLRPQRQQMPRAPKNYYGIWPDLAPFHWNTQYRYLAAPPQTNVANFLVVIKCRSIYKQLASERIFFLYEYV